MEQDLKLAKVDEEDVSLGYEDIVSNGFSLREPPALVLDFSKLDGGVGFEESAEFGEFKESEGFDNSEGGNLNITGGVSVVVDSEYVEADSSLGEFGDFEDVEDGVVIRDLTEGFDAEDDELLFAESDALEEQEDIETEKEEKEEKEDSDFGFISDDCDGSEENDLQEDRDDQITNPIVAGGLVFKPGMKVDDFVRANGGTVSEADALKYFSAGEIRLGVTYNKVLKFKGKLKV